MTVTDCAKDVDVIVSEVLVESEQIPVHDVTQDPGTPCALHFTNKGYPVRERILPGSSIVAVRSATGMPSEWRELHLKRFFRNPGINRCILQLPNNKVMVIANDFPEFAGFGTRLLKDDPSDLWDDIFMPWRNPEIRYASESFPEYDNPKFDKGKGLLRINPSMPHAYLNPDVDGVYEAACFFNELYLDSGGNVQHQKVKMFANEIKSITLKENFDPSVIAQWPVNLREEFQSLIITNDGRMFYTNCQKFPKMSWVPQPQKKGRKHSNVLELGFPSTSQQPTVASAQTDSTSQPIVAPVQTDSTSRPSVISAQNDSLSDLSARMQALKD